ncbi:MAG: YjiH family protein [Clostridia bacterium]
MEKYTTKSILKFAIPSTLGILLFITPLKCDGQFTVLIAVVANYLLDIMGEYSLHFIYCIINISYILTILNKLFCIAFIKKNAKIDELLSTKGFWFFIRSVAFVVVNMIFWKIGPEFIIGHHTGGLVAHSLMPILVCVFLLAALLLPLLLNFGLLDFFGALLIKIMRPVFNLPGRSALDCVASWLGDGSIGVLLTSKQYESGYYSKREATVIATTFSAVSITFCLVVISEVALEHMFLPFYFTVSVAGIIAAIIVPKLPPLSKIPDTYCKKQDISEEIPQGYTTFSYGLKLGIDKAKNAPNLKNFLKEGLLNVIEMWLGVLPIILGLGTITLIIAEYTPILQILGLPFIPIYNILGIPEANLASQTVIIGFADMFLPSVIASSIESELTRFVVAATSVSQLIYMSEIGSIIMGSKIPVSLKSLFIIFLQRTLVTLPVIAILARIFF